MLTIYYVSNYAIFIRFLSFSIQYFTDEKVKSASALTFLHKPCGFYCLIMHSNVIFRNVCNIMAELTTGTYRPTTFLYDIKSGCDYISKKHDHITTYAASRIMQFHFLLFCAF